MRCINITILLIFFFLSSCTEKNNSIGIEMINDELIAFSMTSQRDSINIIKFKVSNTSNDIFYINNMIDDYKINKNKCLYKNGIQLRIFNDLNQEVNYKEIIIHSKTYPILDDETRLNQFVLEKTELDSRRLGYKEMKRFQYSKGGYTNFFIHPNETIYFEYYLNINDTITNENFRDGYANLKKGEKYFATLSIASDSSNYKNVLTRDILKTIRENNVKVFHGIIESKKKVPIKVIE